MEAALTVGIFIEIIDGKSCLERGEKDFGNGKRAN